MTQGDLYYLYMSTYMYLHMPIRSTLRKLVTYQDLDGLHIYVYSMYFELVSLKITKGI